jgi:hypothetical protein
MTKKTKLLEALDREEKKLATLFKGVQLIGEVPIRQEDYLQIKSHLREVLDIYGLTKSTRLLKERWPHVFLIYLSFTAAYNKDLGFWDGVVEDLNLSNKSVLYVGKNHWGKLFLSLCKSFGLDTFPDRQAGHEYLTPIRLQGGIPRYSLPDFFEYVVLPSVEQQQYASLDHEKALEEVQERAEFKYRVDNVVELYLQHGGEIAREFFARTRHMARIAHKGQPIPSPSKLELRPYVVQLFEDFLEHGHEKKTKRRLKSPRLTFWARVDQPLFKILLPEQPIPEKYAYRPHEWHLKLHRGGDLVKKETYPVRRFRKGHKVYSSELEIEIGQPYQQAILAFRSIKEETGPAEEAEEYRLIKHWPIRLLPDPEQPPLMSFDPSGRVIRHTEGLPAQVCRLLIPADVSISITGTGKNLERNDSYWSPWEEWKSELWDLTNAQVLHLIDSEQEEIAAFSVLQPLPKPKLIEGQRLEYSRAINEKPLFIGRPPAVFIPFPEGKTQEIVISRIKEWKLNIASSWTCSPEIEQEISFTNHTSHIKVQEDGIVFPLTEIMGQEPIGTYDLEVINPKDERVSLPFRVWPELEVEGLKPLFVPEEDRGKTELFFTLPKGTRLAINRDPNEQSAHIAASDMDDEHSNCYLVHIPPEVTTGEFLLVAQKDPEPIRVPLELCIPRLQWSLRFDDSDVKEIDWATRLVKQSLPKVKQSSRATLLISADLPRDHRLHMDLALVLPEREKQLQVLSRKTLTQDTPYCSFDLKNFLDTIKQHPAEPFFEGVIRVTSPHLPDPIGLPVVRMTRALNIEVVWLQQTERENWVLHWREPNPLRNRRVTIWSLWQPWHAPVEIKLPDDPPPSDSVPEDGWYMHELSLEAAPLMDGACILQFRAVPPWETSDLPEYPPGENVQYVQTVEPQKRLNWIASQLEKDPKRAFLFHFERACLYDDIDRPKERDQEIAWCSSSINQASIPLLIKFSCWLENRDPFTQKALRMRMYQPNLLKQLFKNYPSREIQEKYLAPFSKAKNVPVDSAQMILDHISNPALVSKSINTLMEEQAPAAVEYIVENINKGNFSDLGAFEILKPQADFALYALLDLPESSARKRLLKKLSEYTDQPLLIYTGWWIRCDAGWGKITRIEDPASGEELARFFIQKIKPVLEIIIRPDHEHIFARVDVSDRNITFPEEEQLYLCTHHTGCRQFISNQIDYVRHYHNRAAHKGLRPAIKNLKSNSTCLRKIPSYSPHPPDKPLV